MDISALRAKLSGYLPADKLTQVDAAYAYSENAHSGQKRASGKPYILHPLTVADILADWRADAPSIVAALLHDVVEDTPITLAQIGAAFGADIARLVDGLSKIERLEGIDRDAREAENFRKLLLAAAEDWRVVFIKLADRLHNMRTLAAIANPARRRKIAEETLEIYAPIAGRLGIAKVKDELQNLSFRYLHPNRHRVLTKAMRQVYLRDGSEVGRVAQIIRQEMAVQGVAFSLETRRKNLYSVYEKMERNGVSFAQVEDIVGFRLIVQDRPACYQTLGILHGLFVPLQHRFRDFIGIPKSNGYQSLHTGVATEGGLRVDVQIRTAAMHETAEHGLAAHWRYKQGGEGAQAAALERLSSLVRLHAENAAPTEFMENIKVDLFPDDMLVLTPQGKIVTLPRGATALDMAYAIHTEVGDHAEAAWVNGRAMPPGTRLNSGDQVRIVTNKAVTPLPHWLNSVKTARARARIRHVLSTTGERETVAIGRSLLAAEVRRLDAEASLDAIDEARWAAMLGGVNCQKREELFRKIVVGDVLPEVAARALLRRRVRGGGGPAQPILIAGAGRSAIHLSPCCLPLPDEPIVGILRKERGLIVHSDACPAVRGASRKSERWIEVRWSEDAMRRLHRSAIALECRNRAGLVSAVSGAISAENVNIVNCHFDDGALEQAKLSLAMMVEVHGLGELQALLAVLRKVPDVLAAERRFVTK